LNIGSKKKGKMKKILLVLVVAVLILPSLSCFANEVKDYAESKNLTLEVLEIIAPLGENGMNENEKALIDEISILPEDIQRDETLLVLFDEIAKDTIVGQDELDRFRDLDQDGLSNQEELEVGTDLLEKDTDNDGLTDFEEVSVYKTDPIEEDSDNDLLKDGAEVLAYKTDPLKPDSDNDRLTDGEEILTYGADPSNPDSDYDGLRDGEEVKDYKTDPINQDTDKDGLSDGDEVLEELWRRYRTDPLKVDSDYDSFTDGEEILVLRSDPLDEDDPFIFIKTSEDSDGDGVMDCDDPEPLKVNLYREIVSWLSKEMKEDALSCIVEGDKVRTFSNLCQKVFENVPHAWSQRGAKAYPKDAYAGRRNIEELNSTWQGPRDILMNFYTYHQKVKHAPCKGTMG
jgi:hypothetical protein